MSIFSILHDVPNKIPHSFRLNVDFEPHITRIWAQKGPILHQILAFAGEFQPGRFHIVSLFKKHKALVQLSKQKLSPRLLTSFSRLFTFPNSYLPGFIGYIEIMFTLCSFLRPPWVPTPGRWHTHLGQTPRRHLFRRILYWLLFWTRNWMPPKIVQKRRNRRVSWHGWALITLAVASRLFFCSCHRSKRRLKGHWLLRKKEEKPFAHRANTLGGCCTTQKILEIGSNFSPLNK